MNRQAKVAARAAEVVCSSLPRSDGPAAFRRLCDLVGVREVARRLGAPESTVYAWGQRDAFPRKHHEAIKDVALDLAVELLGVSL